MPARPAGYSGNTNKTAGGKQQNQHHNYFYLFKKGQKMIHNFEIEAAEKYGVKAAVILQNFKYWIAILGALSFVGGFLKFLQAIAGRMMGAQQLLMILGLIPQGLHIPLYLALLKRHDIIFDWIWEKVSTHITLINYTRAFTGIVWFIVAMTIIGLISQFVRFVRLSTEGFPQSS